MPVAPALPDAALPLPASQPVPEPVFALIEAHKRAYEEFIAVLNDLAVAEQAVWHAQRGKRRAAKAALKEAYAAERHFGELEADALEHLVATVHKRWMAPWRRSVTCANASNKAMRRRKRITSR